MESLDDLPIDDKMQFSQKDRKTMEKYIGGGAPSKKSKSSSSEDDGSGWQKIGYVTIAFALLGNPWVGGMLSKLPYVGGSSIAEFALLVTVFVIVAALIQFYA